MWTNENGSHGHKRVGGSPHGVGYNIEAGKLFGVKIANSKQQTLGRMTLIQLIDQSPTLLLSLSPTVVAVAILLAAFVFERRRKSFRIPGFPQAAGLPLIGNILVNNIAEQCRLWKYVYGDVFQVQLGEIPILVVNTAAAAKAIFTGHANALSSRPNLWTFHQVGSSLSASDNLLIPR